MTNESRRANIAEEVHRSAECLKAARGLVDLKLHSDAVSRAYYAAFHMVRALLLSCGLEPKTHQGALHLFNVHFVRPGIFPSTTLRVLGGLQSDRELADYDASVRFTEVDATDVLSEAESFSQSALDRLRAEGWIEG